MKNLTCRSIVFIVFAALTANVYSFALYKTIDKAALAKSLVQKEIEALKKTTAIHDSLKEEVEGLKREKKKVETILVDLNHKSNGLSDSIKSTREFLTSLEKDFQILRENYNEEVLKRAKKELSPSDPEVKYHYPIDETQKAPLPQRKEQAKQENKSPITVKNMPVTLENCYERKNSFRAFHMPIRLKHVNSNGVSTLRTPPGGLVRINLSKLHKDYILVSNQVCATYGI